MRERACRGIQDTGQLVKRRSADLTSPQARCYRSGDPGAPRAYSLSEGEKHRQECPQPYVARLGHYGNMWGKPQGVKGSVLVELGVLITHRLSLEELTVTALPRALLENGLWSVLSARGWGKTEIRC